MNNMEIITSINKDARDRLFQDLKYNGNELEKQVVKFSGNEPLINPDTGLQLVGENHYGEDGRIGKKQIRTIWRSTWSIAYPRS